MTFALTLATAAAAAASGGTAPPLRVKREVAAALAAGEPVVALESTIISHGMPYPQNLETARAVEEVVRGAGAVPATVAVLDGVCCVGLDDDELEMFAKAGPQRVQKCSRRDLAAVVARRGHGATTVSSTMLLSRLAGIDVFVTGGIGGVHRGAEDSMDVSADLTELGRTPVCVVCAGVKSILDIPRTLEVLETQGVAVVALGTDEFPAFFTRSSGCASPLRVDSTEQVASLLHAGAKLGLGSGTLVAVPIPAEAEADAGPVQAAIDQALAEVASEGVLGRDVTPYVLGRVNELTSGASLAANIALIRNNAAQGAAIAVELAALRRREAGGGEAGGGGGGGSGGGGGGGGAGGWGRDEWGDDWGEDDDAAGAADAPVVVGGVVADLVARPVEGAPLLPRTSNPGSVVSSAGGVARNIAEGLARLRLRPLLLSAVGDDAPGQQLRSHAASLSPPLRMRAMRTARGARTATFSAVEDGSGDLAVAVADMEVFGAITPAYVERHAAALAAAPLCVADANLAAPTLCAVARLARRHATPLWLEPVSVPKGAAACRALCDADADAGADADADGGTDGAAGLGLGLWGAVDVISPNEDEAVAMAAEVRRLLAERGAAAAEEPGGAAGAGAGAEAEVRGAAATLLRAGCRNVLVTRGARGVLWARRAEAEEAAAAEGGVVWEELPAATASVTSTRGAGDSFVAGAAWALVQQAVDGKAASSAPTMRRAVHAGLQAAWLTVQTDAAVSTALCPEAMPTLS